MRRVLALLMMLALAACSHHPPPNVRGPGSSAAGGSAGTYRVGAPYQINGVWYYPAEDYSYDETGIASWYGPGFDGGRTANGEIYDQNELTAAHKTLPMPCLVRVTNLDNGRSLVLRINDRGPFVAGRIIDVSHRAAQLLGFDGRGTARVRVTILAEESRAIADAARARGNLAQAVANAVDHANGGGAALASAAAEPPDDMPPPAAAPRAAVEVNGAPPPPAPQTSAIAASVNESPGDALPGQIVNGRFLPAPVVEERAVPPGLQLYVQVAAFTNYDSAGKLKTRLSNIAQATIDIAQSGGVRSYRLRIGPLATEEQADAILNRLIAAGIDGARVVVD